jgi:hypothetical protein
MSHRQIWTDSTAPEKNGSQHNLQHIGWLICGSVPSFSPKPINEAVGLSQASVDDKLLGFLAPYHQHAIGTFHTCSWEPTHQSLINTGGGYSLECAGFSYTTPRPSQPTVSPFHLRVHPVSSLSNFYQLNQSLSFKGTYGCHVVFWPLGHLLWPTTMPSHS